MTTVRLTSLLLVEERLFEADYFARRVRRTRAYELQYNLNAFLSAARSVTFLLQKEMAHVPGFREWLAQKQDEMRADPVARFFLLLRNFSQKEGRVSTVGFGGTGMGRRWTYRFAGREPAMPAALYDRDVAECCVEHVAKLARLTLEFAEAFPFHSCPHQALTEEGIAALGVSLADVAASAGLPEGWLDVAPPDLAVQLAGVRTLVDGVDFKAIRKLARPPRRTTTRGNPHADNLQRLVLDNVGSGPKGYAMIAAALLLGGIPDDGEAGQ
ncbi:hypothetical protein [Sphingomonas sp.]|uniref:hypothetical protein n=1 Tax=Sphingomonas sp. TaxID=28214 RepID=UPI001B2B8156|nr:hypothetical protein [Sphingomonas sp.]MBO9712476.1 hypothetical protein [Sphingomonas sp.]